MVDPHRQEVTTMMTTHDRRAVWLTVTVVMVVMLASACGAPGGTTLPPTPEKGELETSLNELGVDTTATGRVGPDGEPLPDDYAPLGSSASFSAPEAFSGPTGPARTDELFIVGPEVTASGSRITLLELEGVQIDGGGAVDPGEVVPLHALDEGDHPWVDDDSGAWAQSNNGHSLRAAASGDLDGDGLDELVVVYVDTALAARPVRVLTIDDAEAGFGETLSTVADGSDVLGVQVATGDFDGNGVASVVVALADATGIDLLFLQGAPGSYSVDGSLSKRIAATTEVDQVTARLAVGNLDYDNAQELVVVVNQLVVPNVGPPTGSARYFVFDDASTSFAQLDSGNVIGEDAGVHAARVADVALGDITGNGLDEIVLGGLTSFNTSCEDQPDAIVVALANATGDFEPLGAKLVYAGFFNCPAFGPWRHRFFHVTTPDLDGDAVKEIQAGRYVFASFSEAAPFTEIHQLPQDVFFAADGDASAYLTSNTSSVVAADVTGDGRDNVVLYHQWRQDVRVWGVSAVESVGDDGFAELSRIPTEFYNQQDNVRPLLVPANVDHDSAVLAYGPASHELVFTEPLLVAVMAAAPCSEGIGQNVSACSTTFGNSEATTVTQEFTVSVQASAYVGVKTAANIPFVGEIGADFKSKVSVSASLSAGESYTVAISRRFTSGPLEDAVVFSTIPYDRYVYDILSHPDPDLVGGTVEVLLPREPIVLKVERTFYNGHISAVSTPIGSNVFDHTVGDLSTYPTASRKSSLLGQYGGLENGPLSVGQGTGSTGLGIDVSTEVSMGGSLGIEYEYSVDVTAGPALAGFSVGYGATASLTMASGESTTYEVSVGDLSQASFAEHQYSFGMFTYVQPVGGQDVEVINFWVQ
jgi:hypothetical protein